MFLVMVVLKTSSKEMLLTTEKTINKIWSIGGDNGWYYGTFLMEN